MAKKNPDIISERLRDLRNSRRNEKGKPLTQREVCNAIFITEKSLSCYENGERVPSDSILISLSKYYGVSPDYILGETDYKSMWDMPISKEVGVTEDGALVTSGKEWKHFEDYAHDLDIDIKEWFWADERGLLQFKIQADKAIKALYTDYMNFREKNRVTPDDFDE